MIPTASPMPPLTVLESSLMYPLGVDGVLDLLVAHLGGVDGHEGLVALDERDRAAEDARVEHDVAVHPEHAAAPGGGEAAQQALRGVGLVVALVVHVVHVGGTPR